MKKSLSQVLYEVNVSRFGREVADLPLKERENLIIKKLVRDRVKQEAVERRYKGGL